MSAVIFKCPHCGQKLAGEAENIGLVVECPSCGNNFTLASMCKSKPNPIMCYFGIYRNYFGFRGRMRRREFWWAFLFWWVSLIAAAIVDFAIWGSLDWCSAIFSLGSQIPLVAAEVRRLHDTNKSGWWLPLILLPPINIAYFVWLATDGDKGRNRFGEDPKER